MNKSLEKTLLCRIDIATKYGANVREIIRFQNNHVRKIKEKIAKLNEAIHSPKWSVEFLKHSENSYSIMLVEDVKVDAAVFKAHLNQPTGQNSIIYVDAEGKEYLLKSSVLTEKIKRDTVGIVDISEHLNKSLRKIKTGVNSVANHYGFDKMDLFEKEYSDFSFA